jgi:hypothetical protein
MTRHQSIRDLPPDIWVRVAEYLPSKQLPGMISVNRTFYNLVLDTRYRTVELATINPPALRLLKRLEYVPGLR